MYNPLVELYKRMDLKTYKAFDSIMGHISIGLFTTQLINRESINLFLIPYTIATIISAYNTIEKASNNTKDIQEIKNIYNDIIKNYNNLNKELDVIEPLQVATMFHYTLHCGYLSIDKNFKYNLNSNQTINNPHLLGSSIITGNGVCRHINSMLNDIYNDLGIESYLLIVEVNESSLLTLKKIIGNHAITIAKYDDKIYPVDATSRNELGLYALSKKNNFVSLLDENCYLTPKIAGNFCFHNLKELLGIQKMFYLEDFNLLKSYPNMFKTLIKIEENRDMLEHFHSENKEKFEEVVYKVKKL